MSDEKKSRDWKALEKKIARIKIPRVKMFALRLRYRLALYLLTILFATVSLVQVVTDVLTNVVGIAVYAMAALTLFGACYYLAVDLRSGVKEKVRMGINANPFTRRMAGDYRYRTVMFAVPGLVLNVVFALFNGVIGIYSRSAWYGTLSAYYILLSAMRFLAVRYDRRMAKREQNEELLAEEISVYHKCGILFLVLTVALGGMVILMVFEEEGKSYPGLLIYAVATYTFYKITVSVVNLIKVRKFKSPLLMAIRDIGHIDACVSILSLQTAMFASFGEGQELFIKFMNGTTGSIVCLLVLGIGSYSIYYANKMKKQLSENTGGMGYDKNTCGGR